VFEGAGPEVAGFLAVASKGGALVLLARLALLLSDTVPGRDFGYWAAAIIGVIGAVSITYGNVAALAQTNVRRLLAYSSIAQAGYMMCLVALLAGGSGTTTGGVVQALLVYLTVYLLMNLGAFGVAGLAQRRSGDATLRGLAGLGRDAPLTAACMTLFMISLTGLPPVAGFNAKLYLLVALGRSGGWGWTLAAIVIVNTVISLYYYLRIVRAMYAATPGEIPRGSRLHPLGVAVSFVCAALLVVLFVGAALPERLAPAGRSWTATPAPVISAPAPVTAAR